MSPTSVGARGSSESRAQHEFMLEAQGISKRYGATIALEAVDLSAKTGEIHAVLGENGSGKSTLMKALAGVVIPDSGTMTLGGAPFAPKSPADARRAGVAMIHQELSVCPDLSVSENVTLGAEETTLGVVRGAAARKLAHEALAKMGYAELDVTMPVRRLSPATRQIVEIARAVALDSRVVILDEPTSSLGRADVEALFGVMDVLRNSGKAVLFISHFLDEVRRVADVATVLRDGHQVGVHPARNLDDDEIVRLMVGRSIDELYPRSDRSPGDVVLSVHGLTGLVKPSNATLDLRKGEVLGVAGLNGAGRTELLRLIFGLDRVASGEVRVGAMGGRGTPALRWAQGVGLLSEDRKDEGLFLGLPIYENVMMASLDKAVVRPEREAAVGAEWIERLRVKCQGPRQPVGQLSGGNQQKVALARMLRHGVDVLLLDEPTRGIDVGSKEQIYRIIDDLALQGKAVLMVSSYLPELLGVCDRIHVMRHGDLLPSVDADEATQESLVAMAIA